jgi:hypothetical protein
MVFNDDLHSWRQHDFRPVRRYGATGVTFKINIQVEVTNEIMC